MEFMETSWNDGNNLGAVLITKAYTFVKTVYLKVIHLILCKLHLNKLIYFQRIFLPQHNKIGTLKIK